MYAWSNFDIKRKYINNWVKQNQHAFGKSDFWSGNGGQNIMENLGVIGSVPSSFGELGEVFPLEKFIALRQVYDHEFSKL